jgi:UDP-N-acetyl-2-amino-2-deoxyglucuronate dehydrogenase
MPPNVYGFGHKRYYEQLIQSLKTGGPALVDGLEGRKSLELITAIYESAETGEEVFLKFQPHYSRLGEPDIGK